MIQGAVSRGAVSCSIMLSSRAENSQATPSVAWWITAPGRDRSGDRVEGPTGFS
jgi:hypothetical protein